MERLTDDASIGWIGTGRMGSAMVDRLLGAGRRVSVWNRTHAKALPLGERGATVVDTISELSACDVVFITVATSGDLVDVLTGDAGLFAGAASAPRIVIDSSTVSEAASARARELTGAAGAAFLAAPVSGNPRAIAAGELMFAVSGPVEAFEAALPVLEDIGRGARYVGEGEVARLVKLCHNLYLGLVIQSLAEVTVLAQKGGASRAEFLSFVNDSAMGSVFSRYKTPALVNLDFHPTFTTALLRKDFDLGLDAARELAVPMPVTAQVHEIIQAAIGYGYGDDDFAALIMLQLGAAGLEPESEHAAVDDGLSGRSEG